MQSSPPITGSSGTTFLGRPGLGMSPVAVPGMADPSPADDPARTGHGAKEAETVDIASSLRAFGVGMADAL